MKILFLINCLEYGGAEKNMKIVAEYLLQKGDDITVCSLNYRPTTLSFNNRIRVIDLPLRQGFFLKVLKEKYCDIKEIVCNERPDVIVSFLGYANLLNVFIGKKLKIPSIISERADPYLRSSKWQSNLITKLFQWIYTFADGAVFQTPKARDYFSKRLRRRSIVIPNPVVLPRNIPYHDYDNAKKEIVFVGRFEIKQKRQDLALKAFQKVLEIYPEYILSFYGDGEDEKTVKDMANALRIASHVSFNAVSNNILSDISSAKIYILTSDYEGIPNSLIEAMSIGLPCVSTDCSPGGARMLIDNGENGTIVSCGDVNAIADAVNYYIANPKIAKLHGINAMKIKDKYPLDRIMNLWVQYIHQYDKKRL